MPRLEVNASRRQTSVKKLLVALVIALFLVSFRPPDAASQVPSPIRVVQWNVLYNGRGTDGVLDRARQVAWLVASDPDVITLNEVTADVATDYKLRVERRTGERWYHHHASAVRGGWGNAVLTRFPIVSTSRYVMTRGAQRSVAQATVDVHGALVNVFATHLDSDDPPQFRAEQAEQLLDFAGRFPGPRILSGDMNAAPDAAEIQPLFTSYIDAWEQAVNDGTARAYADNPADRYTRTRRTRIDYILMSHDGTLVTQECEVPDLRDRTKKHVTTATGSPDDEGVRPSDHNLVSCTLAWRTRPPRTGVTTPEPSLDVSAPGAIDEIVLWPAVSATLVGNWFVVADPTAAGTARVESPNEQIPKIRASAEPEDYFEMTFDADAAKPYRLWIRARASDDNWTNDSVSVQFSGTIDAAGLPIYRIGTPSRTLYTLEDCVNCGVSGWGWQDNGFGVGVLGPEIYFESSGPQTIRIQRREDGISIDQVVLSAVTWLSTAPGPAKDDATTLPMRGSRW